MEFTDLLRGFIRARTTLQQVTMLHKFLLENARTKTFLKMQINAGNQISSRSVHRCISNFTFRVYHPLEKLNLT
jgi:hypothetical protein